MKGELLKSPYYYNDFRDLIMYNVKLFIGLIVILKEEENNANN
jgi:hypothetical protein